MFMGLSSTIFTQTDQKVLIEESCILIDEMRADLAETEVFKEVINKVQITFINEIC